MVFTTDILWVLGDEIKGHVTNSVHGHEISSLGEGCSSDRGGEHVFFAEEVQGFLDDPGVAVKS